MTTPQRGFKAVAEQIIRTRPGLTSEKIARIALEERLAGSNSKDRLWSLKTTLDKEYREGRMPGIRVEKVDGKRRYFPTDYPAQAKVQLNEDRRIEIALPPDLGTCVDALLEVGRFTSPGDAVIWLAQQGIRANRPALAQIETKLEEIRRLKKSAQGLV